MIEGVRIKTLRTISDERGWLFEILRSDEDIFSRFGQVYISAVYPGVVKAWHMHEKQTDNITVVSGMVKLVLADLREKSNTYGQIEELFVGDENRILIQIPPLVYHGVKGIGTVPALVHNCPDRPFDRNNPDEVRLPVDSDQIAYDWEIRHG